MNEHEESLKVLSNLGFENLKHERSETGQVTTNWGVNWDEWYIARDLIQNFYDANKANVSDIKIQSENGRVTISAPVEFDLNELYFIGSKKGADDVGQYGEGFKVATACLLKKFGISPIAQSGNNLLRIRLGEADESTANMQPLCYDFFRTEGKSGSSLHLEDCGSALVSALEKSLESFDYPENPLFHEVLYSDDDFAIYSSPASEGHLFYRRLKRASISNIPISLVIRKQFKQLDNLIAKDRDRNAFDDKVLSTFYMRFAKSCTEHNLEVQKAILIKAENCWERGHPLLSEIARNSKRTWSSEQVEEVFGKSKYFAKSSMTRKTTSGAQAIEQLEKNWLVQGLIAVPGYFSKFGLLSAERHISEFNRKVQEEARNASTRAPSPGELTAIYKLIDIMKALSPQVASLYATGTEYIVGETEELLGELRKGRGYKSKQVYLAAQCFESDFGRMLSIFLHEHFHIFGSDGSRGFTDALTELIEVIIRDRKIFDEYEEDWVKIQEQIQVERETKFEAEKSFEQFIQSKSEKELRNLLMELPAHLATKLMLKS
jgi:hypothetical protein